MAANPVTYAEHDLGVHAVWLETQDRLSKYETAQQAQLSFHEALKDVRDKQTDREMQVASEARAKYSELSATAFAPVLKGLIHDDAEHRTLREKERVAQANLAAAAAEEDRHKVGLRALTARMEELGGLLHFYAAAKLNQQNS